MVEKEWSGGEVHMLDIGSVYIRVLSTRVSFTPCASEKLKHFSSRLFDVADDNYFKVNLE